MISKKYQNSASNFKSFSRSPENLFLTVGQNNFGNKIQFICENLNTGKSYFHNRDLFCSVVAFDVEVESYILNLQTIGKKQLSFIHFFADITEFITFSWISESYTIYYFMMAEILY